VAHNPQAARELAAWCGQVPASGRTLGVFAALGDKDAAGIVDAMAAAVDAWYLGGLDGPRGLAVVDFAARLQATAAAHGEKFATVEGALDAALAQARAGDRVLVFGSFHTAGAALRALQAPV
jgi:dihydrofolate synthase/folylpolyglutamate synthase